MNIDTTTATTEIISVTPLLPLLALSLGGVGYLLCGGLLEATKMCGWFTLFILAATLALIFTGVDPATASAGFALDPFSRLLALFIVAAAIVSVLSSLEGVHRERIERLTEYYFLVLMAVAGALILVGATDFLTIFVGLELASLALYPLCCARVEQRASSEAALKYFLLGCFSSAFLLYGIAFWYGATSSLSLIPPSTISIYTTPLMMGSFLLILVGFAFKLGLAPFHLWVPDVYQGAPTSVTTLMSCIVKIAAFGALIKIAAFSFLLPNEWGVKPLWVIAVVAMCLGNLAALRQSSLKRMLAYSSVAQMGYMMMGLVSLASGDAAIGGAILYLVSYCALSIGAFATLGGIGPDADEIDSVRGLGKQNRTAAILLTVFFIGLAGLPPLITSLVGKLYLFSSAIAADFTGLVIIAAINSVVAFGYYLRVPLAVWFLEQEKGEQVVVFPLSTTCAAVLCAVVAICLGFAPDSFVEVVTRAYGDR